MYKQDLVLNNYQELKCHKTQPAYIYTVGYVHIYANRDIRVHMGVNGYHHRTFNQLPQFKSWLRLVAFHVVLITLGKVWILLFF